MTPPPLRPRPSLAWRGLLLGTMAVAVAARLAHVSGGSLTFDEAWSLRIARGPGLADVVRASGQDTHPPLHPLLLHVWMSLFGSSEAAVRSLSVVFGVLLVPVACAFAVRWRGRRAALLVGLAVALSDRKSVV